MTNILGITEAGILFKPLLQEPNEFGIRPFYAMVRNPMIIHDGLTLLSGNIGLVPSVFLALLRTIKVTRPFYHYSKKRYAAVMTIIVLYYAVTTIVSLSISADTVTSLEDIKEIGTEAYLLLKSLFILSSLLIIMGNTSCLVTMVYLYHYKNKVKVDVRVDVEKMQNNDKEKKAIITLLLMNAPFCFEMVVFAAYVYHLFKLNKW